MQRLAIILALLTISGCWYPEEHHHPRTRRGEVGHDSTPHAPVMCHDSEGNPYRVTEGYWHGCEWRECDWDGWIATNHCHNQGCWIQFCDNYGCWDEWYDVGEGYSTPYELCWCGWWDGYDWIDDGLWTCEY